jgi:flavodoxin/Fe-S-cluster-containing hydrogenase component 2
MKAVIVYYSLTGNTEKIAKAVRAGVEAECGACDLIKIKDANPRQLYKYDLIGIGSPIYLIEPENVQEFIDALWSVGGKHAFSFNTHGTLREYYFPSVLSRLRARGLTVVGFKDWYADVFIPWHPEPYPTTGHPDEIDLAEAEAFGREMVVRSMRIKAGESDLIPADPPTPPPLPSEESLGITDTSKEVFKFHPEMCRYPRCRLCMDNCPRYGIDLSVDPPVIADPCLKHCTFCTQVCPTGALEIDAFVEEQAPHYRYTTESLTLPKLVEAEKEGTFRRLVPVDEIGWDTYYYQVHNKHPKWRIGRGPV